MCYNIFLFILKLQPINSFVFETYELFIPFLRSCWKGQFIWVIPELFQLDTLLIFKSSLSITHSSWFLRSDLQVTWGHFQTLQARGHIHYFIFFFPPLAWLSFHMLETTWKKKKNSYLSSMQIPSLDQCPDVGWKHTGKMNEHRKGIYQGNKILTYHISDTSSQSLNICKSLEVCFSPVF